MSSPPPAPGRLLVQVCSLCGEQAGLSAHNHPGESWTWVGAIYVPEHRLLAAEEALRAVQDEAYRGLYGWAAPDPPAAACENVMRVCHDYFTTPDQPATTTEGASLTDRQRRLAVPIILGLRTKVEQLEQRCAEAERLLRRAYGGGYLKGDVDVLAWLNPGAPPEDAP